MVFKNICTFVLWTKVSLELKQPINALSSQMQLGNFDKILLTKIYVGMHLKDNVKAWKKNSLFPVTVRKTIGYVLR